MSEPADTTSVLNGQAPASTTKVPVAEVEEIMPTVYEELRRLASAYLRGERTQHTLQGTALVHEAYLRLRNQTQIEWQNPAHFIAIFARVMRQTLANYAVARNRIKRGGTERMELAAEYYKSREIDVKALDEALDELETIDHRQAQIVELRFFGGLTVEEVAEVLAVSPGTVKRDWTFAKAWLQKELLAS